MLNPRATISRIARSSGRLVRCRSQPELVLGGKRGQATAIQPQQVCCPSIDRLSILDQSCWSSRSFRFIEPEHPATPVLQEWTVTDYLAALRIDDPLAGEIIRNTPLDHASGEDVRARLTFLSGFGPVFTQSSIAAIIRRYFRYNQRLWPLIDTSLPLEDLASFLYLQGASPRVRSASAKPLRSRSMPPPAPHTRDSPIPE